jgi:hypothetical protein
MKKSLIIIGIVVIIMGSLIVGGSIWYSGLKKDETLTKEKMDKVLKAYPTFNKNIDSFSNLRTKFYEKKEDLYLESLRTEADSWNEFMASYASGLKTLEESAKDLKENCNIEYGDVKVSSECTSFKANYEAANNYYLSDIKMYNAFVDEYNKTYANKKSKYVVNKVDYFVYKNYIDYDKDGEYFGKVEEKSNE